MYFFRRILTYYKEQQILSGSLAVQDTDLFGASVAMNSAGDRVVVGAYEDEGAGRSGSSGTAYIFVSGANGWSEQVVLSGSLAVDASDNFGYFSVDINEVGDRIIVGAYLDEGVGRSGSSGTAYVFVSGAFGWTEEQVLSGSLATEFGDLFGCSVSMNASGDRVIVGSYADEGVGRTGSSGTAYIFNRTISSFAQNQILLGSLAIQSNDSFGESVAVSSFGDIIVVGAPSDESLSGPANYGAAYVYITSSLGWLEQQTLTPSSASSINSDFGKSVCLSSTGNSIAIGSPDNDPGGRVYVFKRQPDILRETKVLSGSFASSSLDYFGWSIAMNSTGDRVVVGAPDDESPIGLSSSGLAYIFIYTINGWVQQAILSGSIASSSLDYFGYDVAMNASGNLVAIGAYGDEAPTRPDASGLVYIFNSGSTGWAQQAILSGSLAVDASDQFGVSIAMNSAGNRLIVGSNIDEGVGRSGSSGTAYIFVSGAAGWTQQAILSGSLSVDASDNFGVSTAINSTGDRVVVGANNDEGVGRSGSSGTAYIFVSGAAGWTQQAILSGSLSVDASDGIGLSLSMNSIGDRIVMGLTNDEGVGITGSSGTAYIFVSGTTGWRQQTILSGSLSVDASDNFGISTAINSIGDRVVVGAHLDEGIGRSGSTGLAYLFVSGASGWVQQSILSGSLAIDNSLNDTFGYAVAINGIGDVIASTALQDELSGLSDTGLAYIFKIVPTWIEEQILFGSLATGSSELFGYSVSINSTGDRIIVGAYQDEGVGRSGSSGTAYIFASGTSGWIEQQILSGSFAQGANDVFGASVYMNSLGDRVIVGAPQDSYVSAIAAGDNTGTAYIFVSGATGWIQQAILSGSLAVNNPDYFGTSVAMNFIGDRVIVGAPYDETGAPTGSGVAYIFVSGAAGWTQQQILSGSLANNADDYFGWSVDMNAKGDRVVVGAHQDEGVARASGSGTTYVFASGTLGWVQHSVLSGTLATGSNDYFGYSVAMNSEGDLIATGAPLDENINAAESSGLVYMHQAKQLWVQQTVLSGSLAVQSGDNFGFSVSINSVGDRVVVGNYNDEGVAQSASAGTAYIFVSGAAGWTQQAILSGSLAVDNNDYFGWSVAMNTTGDRIIVGAYEDEGTGRSGSSGTAYIFVSGANGWIQQQILTGSLAVNGGDSFGFSVAMNSIGDRVVIGALSDEGVNLSDASGLVYIFVSGATGWIEHSIMNGSLATGSIDNFGYCVAMNSTGERVIVGANNDEGVGRSGSSGTAYIFNQVTETFNR
jgi:hypothetical protein